MKTELTGLNEDNIIRALTKYFPFHTKMSTSLTINLKRPSKVYHEGDIIAGVVVVKSAGETRHEGLALAAEGAVNLQVSSKNTGLFDAFSNSIKPINLLNTSVELAPPGKIPAGVTEIPFEIPLRPRQATSPGYPGLLETYHGVFVNIMYTLKCGMKRSFLNKPLNASCQFFVQYKHQAAPAPKPVRCEVTPASVRAGGGGGAMPQFSVYAEIDSTVCALDKPLTGKIRVDSCPVGIKSIELQLVRVETCGCAEGYSRDATEIQNIQVGEGDVARARDVPLHMVLPRLFVCPTTTTVNFKIEFELNIAVIFEDDYLGAGRGPDPLELVASILEPTAPGGGGAGGGGKAKAAGAGKEEADGSNFTVEQRAVAAVWVHERLYTKNSLSEIKRHFEQRFGRSPPAKNTMLLWERKLFATGSVHDAPRPGRPARRKLLEGEVRASLRSAPGLSMRARAAALGVPRSTMRALLRRGFLHEPGVADCIKPAKKKKQKKQKAQQPDSRPPPAAPAPAPLPAGST